jgi:hypothetical protein
MSNESTRDEAVPMAGCHRCDEPLVLTFEFPKKEFICVECGQLYEYFGPKRLTWTPERQARHDELAERYKAERAARAEAARRG